MTSPPNSNRLVQGRTAQGRRLQVRRMAPGEAPTGIHVLFIGGEAAPKILQAAKTLTERSVLTITGIERGIDHGSVINFVHVDGRVRFEVNVGVAEKERVASELAAADRCNARQAELIRCSTTSPARSAAS